MFCYGTFPYLMKIGILAHLKHPIRSPFAGGLEVFTYEITRSLQERGHEVILFASSMSSRDLPLEPILSDSGYNQETGIRKKIKDLPSEYISEHLAYLNLMLKIDEYKLDAIFNNSLHYVPIMMATLVSTPMLTVLHTPPFYELELAIKAERTTSKVKYCTISASNSLLWRKHSGELDVVYNGIDVDRWQWKLSNLDKTYAFWSGRIHPDKGLHYAIAAARFAGIKLVVAGGIADKKYFNNYVRPLLGEDIIMLGNLAHQELNHHLANAAVCLITPCWEEPFGLVVPEAMACGTPIAGFRIGALPELIPSTCGHLVDPGDVEALSTAIHKAKRLDRKIVRQYAENNFSYHAMIENYERMLMQVIKKQEINEN